MFCRLSLLYILTFLPKLPLVLHIQSLNFPLPTLARKSLESHTVFHNVGMFDCRCLCLTVWLVFVCLSAVPGPQSDGSGGGNDMFLMAMVWVVLGVLLYLFRPSSMRNSGDSKPARLVCTALYRTHWHSAHSEPASPGRIHVLCSSLMNTMWCENLGMTGRAIEVLVN